MRTYTVAIDVIDLLRDIFQVTIKPSEQSSMATSVRRYEDVLSFRADVRKHFGLTERAVTRMLNGDSDHEVLFNQSLDDATAKYFNYVQPAVAPVVPA
jgi:hypothetical protein